MPRATTRPSSREARRRARLESDVAWDSSYLQLEHPERTYSLSELGAGDGEADARSPLAITSAFRILSDDGVAALQAICAELRRHARATTWTATQSIGAVLRSRFLHGLSRDATLARFLSEIAQAPLEPHPLPHTAVVVNYPPNEASRELSPWHQDAIAFDYVLMVSDPKPMKGGRFEYFLGSLDEARRLLADRGTISRERIRSIDFPGAGWALFHQGDRVVHRVTRLERPYERTTLVGAYWLPHPRIPDAMRLDHFRKAYGDDVALREWGGYVAELTARRLRSRGNEFVRPLQGARGALEAALAERKAAMNRPLSSARTAEG
jgi:hypothetical protein